MAMDLEFSIDGWSASAPGLDSREQWIEWAVRPVLPSGTDAPSLSQMPPLMRRRLNRLGRCAAQAAYELHDSPGVPVVLASRYGDAERSLALLRGHASGEVMSPTDFTLSVHNAIGALYSIARADTASYTSIAGGRASAACGMLEAAGLLRDGHAAVLLVCYDSGLPQPYAGFEDEPAACFAWAARVVLSRPGLDRFSLSHRHQAVPGPVTTGGCPDLPSSLQVLQFLLGGARELLQVNGRENWRWSRHVCLA